MRSLLILLALTVTAHGDFALRDGDTVAFLGDSITAARGYPKVVEHYTLMRFPERKVRFVNAGEGGDTASGCLGRLDRDVFDRGATVVTVAFGINDIGWGTKADDEHKAKYLEGVRTIIERCRERGVRPIICSPAVTEGDPDEAEAGFLQAMADEGLALAKSMGAETIDIQRGMREVQRRVIEFNRGEPDPENRVRLHVKDGVHLDDLGQMAMAYAMLKGLGAPDEVSAVLVDAGQQSAEGSGCTVDDLVFDGNRIRFTRLDRGLPLNLGPFTGLQYRWIPIPDGLNGYSLAVKGLAAGEYQIFADGRDVGKCTAEELQRGLNIASRTGNPWLPGGPWDVQSCAVKELVDARDKLWMGGKTERTLGETADAGVLEEIDRLDAALVGLQRRAARPRKYHFEIVRLP